LEKKKKAISVNCIQEQDFTLDKKYTDVIKQYTFIQKEYRDILINEFTTENEYVKKSNEIFNSDIEFINKFNDFIEALVLYKGRNTLIFIFIDDIDLSTNRCTEIVKTPNIVTFISGDLDTFEEALTIDFLRKEEALTSQVWHGKFVGDKKLFDSKKTLAYEYLKKVIPPTYRHTIKRWSLEKRGNYVIKTAENSDSLKLSELLVGVLDYIHPSLFKFINYESNSEGKEENLKYTYHMFDDTSRGLNNVYNILLSMYEQKKRSDKVFFSDLKIFVETIVASKEIFSKY
jgi:hypothetical protein